MTHDVAQPKVGPWRVGLVSGMASYIDAAAIVSFGTAIVIYQTALGLTPNQVGLASGALTLGIAVGALTGGRLGDRYGRRPVFTITMVAIVAAAVALALATTFPVIFIAALVLGLATGADLPVSLASIAEAADDSNRGRLLGFSNLLWMVGSVVSILFAGVVGNMGRPGGQILFIHIGAVAAVILVARLFIPESPVWLEAREARRAGTATQQDVRVRVTDLLRGQYRAPFVALLVFYGLTNLAANTGGQFGSYLLVNYAGVDVQTGALIAIPFIPLGVIGYLWFMKIADSPKRFSYFTVGAALWVVSQLIPAAFGISLGSYIAAGVVSIAGTSFAFEGMMKVWSQEQFPTLLRTTAQGTIIAVARFLAAILATVTPLLVDFSPRLFYVFLAAMIAAGCGTAWAVFRTRDQQTQFEHETAPTAPATQGAVAHG